MNKVARNILVAIILIAAAYVAGFYLTPLSRPTIGVTFNADYSRFLGQNPDEVLKKIMDGWKFKYLRLSVPWNQVEPTPGVYDFSETDKFLSEAQKRGVKVTLALGQKTPRWPECHTPAWADKLSDQEFQAALEKYMTKTVEHFRNNPALEIWQVENEPFLDFGICRPETKENFAAELALVKNLDPKHPRLVTDSGELSSWRATAKAGEYFGSTMYRVVWNKLTGYWNYDWLSPWFYRIKLALSGRAESSAFISELQAEPWLPNSDLNQSPLIEQYKSMNMARLKKNIDYARMTGFARVYLWGAEWWYYLDKKGEYSIPDFIKNLPKE